MLNQPFEAPTKSGPALFIWGDYPGWNFQVRERACSEYLGSVSSMGLLTPSVCPERLEPFDVILNQIDINACLTSTANFRTEICKYWEQKGSCTYGDCVRLKITNFI